MRLRRWTALIALFGVLLHAGALVRHHGVMLGALLQEQAQRADLAFICHGGEDTSAPARGDLPGNPKPSSAKGDCPVCGGQVPAVAVVAPRGLDDPVRFAAMAHWCEPERANPALRHAVCPPPRGPPASSLSV
jgi:hypothetical protein